MKNYKELLKYILLLVLFCVVQYAFSQKSVTTQHQTWTQYFCNIRLAERWSAYGDVLYRVKDLAGSHTQTGIRAGLVYHFKHPITFTVGYVYFVHFPIEQNATITRHEHRPWQQLLINTKYGRLQVQHRYRFEQRFIENATLTAYTGGFGFNFRARYQLNLLYPLNKKEVTKGTLSMMAFNEIMANFGKEVTYTYFDQDRTWIGLGYAITKSLTTTLGYQYIWQQRQRAGSFNSTNCLRVTFIHNLDARKKSQ